MIDFTLSKAQIAARDYAHMVAVEEMRPISLECERTEKIPEIVLLEYAETLLGRSRCASTNSGCR